MSLNGAPLETVLNNPAFSVVAVRSSSPATNAGMARAPSAKYFSSASRLIFSKNFRASAMNIGPDEIRGTSPIRIFVDFSCARRMAGAEATNESAAVPARRRRRSIFILVLLSISNLTVIRVDLTPQFYIVFGVTQGRAVL